MERIHILAFGAHPDDVEIGAGGILAKHNKAGLKTAICDLTMGELSSNGTVDTRQQESQIACQQLGVRHRINLGFPDRGLTGSPDQIRRITQVIRQWKPKVVIAPYEKDRHPDHVACSHLVREAVFNANIQKYRTDGEESVHSVHHLYSYFIHDVKTPDLIVDVSEVYQKKQKALAAYQSQFRQNTIQTLINQPSFLRMIEGRDQGWGHQAGLAYGEGLLTSRPIVQSLLL